MVDTSSKEGSNAEETKLPRDKNNTDFQRTPYFVKCESCYYPHHNIQILYGNYYSLEKHIEQPEQQACGV